MKLSTVALIGFAKSNNIIIIFLKFLILSCIPNKTNLCSNHPLSNHIVISKGDNPKMHSSLETLILDGYFSFYNNHLAAKDFGNRYHFHPSAVLHPESVSDISTTIYHIYKLASASKLTVAARGNGHSLQAQAQAQDGIVINMRSLQGQKVQVHTGKLAYVDVSAGELWINILHETLKYGLSPKSWTDYLHLTVGGTLSNAGISGQAFRHGPQINNVYQLEVVTGRGEVVNCSKEQNRDLFYGVLGGLGQFGIITRARISIEAAPTMVKWIRVLYSEFSIFSKDQEYLIALESTFDYIEGFVIINRPSLLDNWRASFSLEDPIQASNFTSQGKILYCLEVAKYDLGETDHVVNQQKTESLLSQLNYIPSMVFTVQVSYVDFLERVHKSEIKLRAKGLWEVPHPWLNLFIPRSKILYFAQEVFGKIVKKNNNWPIIIYPVNKSKWNNKTSLVTPEEDVFYLVGLLSSAVTTSKGKEGLDYISTQNQKILDFCAHNQLGVKQYLPHYSTKEEWRAHFGQSWEVFLQKKLTYDPLAILSPGQRIFRKAFLKI